MPPLRTAIDEQIARAWTQRGVAPAALSADDEFLGRVTLDLTGTIPTVAAARAFFDDATPDKRARVIDALLASPEHAHHDRRLRLYELPSS